MLFRSGFAHDGHLRPGVDLHLQRILLLGAANSTLEWFRPDGPTPLEALADALAEQFWHGVAAPTETRRPTSRPTRSEGTP